PSIHSASTDGMSKWGSPRRRSAVRSPSRSTTSLPGSGRWWGRRAIRTPTTTSLLLVARGKLNPARLVTRQIALGDVTDTLQRMTRFETVGFEAITWFALTEPSQHG